MMRLAVLDEDLAFDVPFSEETRRYSHFEIALEADGSLCELGHGTMGTTYRAQDTVLHAAVALKVMGRNVADSPDVRARFLREARAAARLRHPNVATVFHYGEQEGECFYIMELVEGETLQERVRRDGPLPADLALEIGAQVAGALAAAEAQHLVHRDLKPSNLMLVTNAGSGEKPGRAVLVKVIDFGLAKVVAASEDPPEGENDTRRGFVGTPAFASPEQFSHGAGGSRVDTRSDIYSLGVTLWFLLCGRTPFQGHTLEQIHGKQISQPLALEQLAERRVPAPVVALLRTMLAVDPGERPQSARELLEKLERCAAKVARAHRGVSSRLWAALAALALLGVPAAMIVVHERVASHASPPIDPLDRSVAVLPFQNLSPDNDVAFFTDGVQDQITAELARISELKVIGSPDAGAYPPDRRDTVRIGQELNVGHLVEGSVRRVADRVQVAVKLVDLRHQSRNWTRQYEGRLADVFAIQREITREVAARLRATLSPREAAAIDEPPTTDPVAYDLYLRAAQGSNESSDPAEGIKSTRAKIAWLEEAVARDPKFVLAYCALSELHDEMYAARMYATGEEKDVDHRALAEIALQKARRIAPTEGRIHLAQAHHFSVTVGDSEQARIEIDLARQTLPNNPELEQAAGMIARTQGRWQDAVRDLEKAAALQPRETIIMTDLVWVYRSMRRYEDADRANARVIALMAPDPATYQVLFRATGPLEERADLGPLRAALAAITPLSASDKNYKDIFSLILATCAHDPDAISRILAGVKESALATQGFFYPKGWFEGVAGRIRGDSDGAHAAFASARPDVEKKVLANPDNAKMLSLLAMIDAGLGRNEDAMREGREAYRLLSPEKSATASQVVGSNLAVVYAWTAQPDLAFQLLDEMAGRAAGINLIYQPTFGDLRLNPLWDPLRGDPRFAALVARLAPKNPR